MNTLEAISTRRSIRRFESRPLPRELVAKILGATVQAPSAKNEQPWRFVVLEGSRRDQLVRMMLDKAAESKARGRDTGSLEWTAKAMAPAPTTIVIFSTAPPAKIPTWAHDSWNFVMLQSTGGAIQTMLLAAHELGLGALWICDILYVDDEVKAWLGRPEDTLVAAVTLGYTEEKPNARPRRPWQEVTEWPADG